MKQLHSGKGVNLAEMSDIGLPMPSGFTFTTEVCDHDSTKGARPCATVV
jgi:pyruvate,orthophosphate dikinase